jgi:hypothetical protein
MPFARSPEEEAERWLRVLRLHGDVSAPLQALGVGEVPITADDGLSDGGVESELQAMAGGQRKAEEHEVVKGVTERATDFAQRRGARAVGTVDVLVGAMDFYGEDFDRILRAYGTDREEVLERVLAAK